MKHRFNPRALFRWGHLVPHAMAFNDDPDGGGGDPPADPPTDPTGGTPNDGGTPSDSQLFSQDDVNRIIAERVKRAEAAGERRALETLGYEDIEAARKAKAEREKAHEAKLLEEKKYEELLQQRDARNAQLEAELERERNQRIGETVMRTVLAAATEAGALAPQQVAQLTRDNFRVSDSGVVQVINPLTGEVLTDGKGSELTARAFIDRWLEANPHYKRAATGRGSNAGAPGGSPRPPKGFDPNKKGDFDHLRDNREEIIAKMKAGELKG